MSGGFTPSLKRTDVALSGKASFLASERMTVKRGGITLDSTLVAADADGNKILEAGTFVAEVTATGKYGVYDAAALDGRQTPSDDDSGYLLEAVNLKDGDVICGLLVEGSVLEARVTPALDATIRDAVKGRIIFQ